MSEKATGQWVAPDPKEEVTTEDNVRKWQEYLDRGIVEMGDPEWRIKALLDNFLSERDQLASIARGLSTCITQGAQLETPDMLDWIADRLVKVHGEDPNVDYVMTLRVRANNMRAALSRYTKWEEGQE